MEASLLSLGTGDLGTRLRGDDANRLLDAYAGRGGNLLDTAHVYAAWAPGGEGASERAVGEWLRRSGARSRTLISTKGGHPPMEGYPHAADFLRPEAIQKDVAESLERLGTDWIDLYYLHRDDGRTPVGEIIDGLNALPALRALGASNWSLDRVEAANAYAARTGKRGFVALQNQWSLAVPVWSPTDDPSVRLVTDADRDRCAALGVTIHAYSATANGYFGRDDAQDDKGGAFFGNVARRERAIALAERLGKTPTQVAIAWLLNQPCRVVPLFSTTKIAHLDEAFGALGLEIDAPTRACLRG